MAGDQRHEVRYEATIPASWPPSSGSGTLITRPGGDATRFINFEYGISAKWLELLKQIAPRVTRVAVTDNESRLNGGDRDIGLTAQLAAFSLDRSKLIY